MDIYRLLIGKITSKLRGLIDNIKLHVVSKIS